MDQSDGRSDGKLIYFTEAALADLVTIDNATFAMWGQVQAERYLAFLQETLSLLEAEPGIAARVEQRPGYRVWTAKFRKRRSAYGHRIFFREVDGGIEIIRILHTSMSWPDRID